MKKRLIVNADDFGLCEEISTGIIKAYREGIVTSTSVVVNGSYFKQGIALLKDSGIDAGIHFTFIGREKPVSGAVDGLVDEQGLFLKGYNEAISKIIAGRFDKDALRRELFEQISILREAGVAISHIDSHQHLHLLPNVSNMIIDLANQFKIKWIRVPRSSIFGIKGIGMNSLSELLKLKMRRYNLCYTDRFIGFEKRGHINEHSLLTLLPDLKYGTTELMVHPGYNASKRYDWEYDWEDELKALTSEAIKAFIKENEIVLTSFKEI